VMKKRPHNPGIARLYRLIFVLLILCFGVVCAARLCLGAPQTQHPVPSVLKPESTPADTIYHLSFLVTAINLGVFALVFGLLVYVIFRFGRRTQDPEREPAQVYGSTQIELAWTVIPVLIVLILFLATARVIHGIQDARKPEAAVDVTVIGHQFWWEFRYPKYGVVTANELHIPVSDPSRPTPTFLQLLSADTDHSFWIPQLAGKTDLIPNRTNEMWMDPKSTGVYVGQCAQYCGTQHAKMLLRVTVDSQAEFHDWIRQQQKAVTSANTEPTGRQVFETTACVNCHAIEGTAAKGRFGPDLTHLMSRTTIASGAAANTAENLRLWIQNPDAIKPGSLMPAMKLNESDLDALVRYLRTLE
jgi:cytochrome c oxidase subunit 2